MSKPEIITIIDVSGSMSSEVIAHAVKYAPGAIYIVRDNEISVYTDKSEVPTERLVPSGGEHRAGFWNVVKAIQSANLFSFFWIVADHSTGCLHDHLPRVPAVPKVSIKS